MLCRYCPGASVTLAYDFSVAFNSGTGYCPSCFVQSYVGIGGTNTTLQCENGIGNGTSGSRNLTFTAPTTPGYYYLTQNGTLDYFCQNVGFSNRVKDAIGVIQVGGSYAGLDVNSNDNCSAVTVTNNAPACFPQGNTIVTYTVTDVAGNASTCTQVVTVPVVNTTLAALPIPTFTNPACDGQPATISIPVVCNVGLQWFQDGSPISGATTATYSIPSASVADNGDYYVVATSNSCGSATSPAITFSVNPAPAVSISASNATLCPSSGPTSTVLTASGANTYVWTPGGSTNNPEIFSPTATTTYSVIGTDGNGCTGTASTVIVVGPSLTLMPTATPGTICEGSSSQLDAGFTGNVSGNVYTGSPIAYSPIPTPGTGVTTLATSGAYVTPPFNNSLDDDFWTVALPFSFTYYGNTYSTIYIGTNGHLDFQSSHANSIPGYNALPDNYFANSILPLGGDVYLYNSGTVECFVTGTMPNRKFVVNYSDVHFFGDNGIATVQAVLSESNGNIEFHTTNFSGNNSDYVVQGIQNPDASVAVVVPGRNSVLQFVNTPDGYLFSVPPVATLAWTPAASLSDATINSPVATPTTTTTYVVTATDPASGCASMDSVELIVTPNPTITLTPTAPSMACGSGFTQIDAIVSAGVPTYWSPVTDIFTDPDGTMPYLQGDTATTVYVNPSSHEIYTATTNNTCGTNADSANVTVTTMPTTLAGTGNSTDEFDQEGAVIIRNQDCELIATVQSTGTQPIDGLATGMVDVGNAALTTGDEPFVGRVYNIEPMQNAATSTGTITLYYTQADFDNYNAMLSAMNAASNNPQGFNLLPTDMNDAQGIANFRLTQFHGTAGYVPMTGVLITPSLTWSSSNSWWEATFFRKWFLRLLRAWPERKCSTAARYPARHQLATKAPATA